MFSSTLLLALVAAHSLLITAAPNPAPQDAAAPVATSVLYTITSATIKQYSGAPPNGTSKLRRRQDSPAQPADLPAPAGTTGSSTATTGPAAAPTPPAEQDPAPDANGNENSAAAAANPIWTPLDPKMENFNLTLVPGAVQDTQPPISCNLTWNAGEAKIPTRDSIVSKTFTCTGGQAAVRMERRDMTPDYGFYIFVQVGSTPQAAWMVKDLPHSPGWTLTDDVDTFQGAAPLTDVPHQTLADFLTS